jgi:hypothetical protein
MMIFVLRHLLFTLLALYLHLSGPFFSTKEGVLNDLDEKVRNVAEIIIEKPSMQIVYNKSERPVEELVLVYYILSFVLMPMLCVKEMYSMKRNGRVVIVDEKLKLL